jgi:hypothetical protein
MFKLIEEEEAADNQLRQTYQQKWNRLPSNALNINFKNQLSDLQAKALMASETDTKVESKFAVQGDSLKLLSKTKNELSALIP